MQGSLLPVREKLISSKTPVFGYYIACCHLLKIVNDAFRIGQMKLPLRCSGASIKLPSRGFLLVREGLSSLLCPEMVVGSS